jgi:hypothetical protein
MCNVQRLTLTTCGTALLALVLADAPAHAQRFVRTPGLGGTLNPFNYFDPYGSSRQAAFNIALYGGAMSQVPPYALGYNPYQMGYAAFPYGSPALGYGGTLTNNLAASYASPGYGSGYNGSGYSNSYMPYYDPVSGFLQGAAGVTSAEGKFRINNQQANLQREQVGSAHIDNRRKAFDEFLHERANTPTWLDDLERQKKLNLRYTLTNASGSEILSALSLNTLLDSLKQMQSKGNMGKDVPVSAETLDKINVSAGGGVNPGLLKSEKLTWPQALASDSAFQNDRKVVERNLAQAVREAELKQVEPGRVKDLQTTIDKMTEELGQKVGEMAPSQYIDAKNYLGQLHEGVRALSRPDGNNYLNGKYAAKGKTVADLVKNMSGLQFAPATPGAEQAYKDLYDKLVEYHNRAQASGRGE